MATKPTIYLDDAASTPVAPQVLDTLTNAYRDLFGNPSSLHGAGVAARGELERCRRGIANYFEVSSREIHFTSGGTESNNLAITGVARSRRAGHILTVATEHASVLYPIQSLVAEGFEVSVLPVQPDGTLDLQLLEKSIRPDTFLVSIMMVNNETGVIHPIREIGKIAREKGLIFHCDATQGIRTLRFKPKELGIHLMSASGHKIHGPKGVGLLYVDQTLAQNQRALLPLQRGGPQEQGLRAGTENVPAVCALAEAFQLLNDSLEMDHAEAVEKRAAFIEGLSGIECSMNAAFDKSVPSIVNVRIFGVEAISVMRNLDHIHVSAGSACSGAAPSHVLKAMGRTSKEISQSIRFSFGRGTSRNEVRQAAADIVEFVKNVSK